jgi:hypothetical protein
MSAGANYLLIDPIRVEYLLSPPPLHGCGGYGLICGRYKL